MYKKYAKHKYLESCLETATGLIFVTVKQKNTFSTRVEENKDITDLGPF